MRKYVLALAGVLALSFGVHNTADAAKNSRSCVCQVGGNLTGKNVNCTTTGSFINNRFHCTTTIGPLGDGEGEGKGNENNKCDDEDGCKNKKGRDLDDD